MDVYPDGIGLFWVQGVPRGTVCQVVTDISTSRAKVISESCDLTWKGTSVQDLEMSVTTNSCPEDS